MITKKNIMCVVAFASLVALSGCAAPAGDESSLEASSAVETEDPDLKMLLPGILNGTIDVIIVRRTATSDLAKKIIEAGGKLQVNASAGPNPISGEVSGKFKLEDLKELLVKKDVILVVVKAGTGGSAASDLFKSQKVIDAIDKTAGDQGTAPKDPPPATPPAPTPPPTTPPAAPPGGMGGG